MLGNIIKPLVKGGVDDFAKAVARGAGSVADDAAKAAVKGASSGVDDAAKAAVKGASSGVDDAAKAAVRSSGDNVATAAVGKTKIAQPVERHLRDPGMNPRLRGLEPAPPSPLKPEIKRTIQELRDATPEQRRAIFNRIKAVSDDRVKFAKMLKTDPDTGKFWALHNELWINSLLSGPTTQMVNAISSGLKAAVFMPLDKMMGGWGGFRGGLFNIENKELFEEGVRSWSSMASQFRDSLTMAKKAFETGENILKSNNTIEFANQGRAWQASTFGKSSDSMLGKAIDYFGQMINLPTRFLLTTDEFVSQITYRSTLQLHLEQTARRMVSEGRLTNDPTAIADFIKQNFDLAFLPKRTARGEVIEQGAGIVKEALKESAEANFATPLRHGSLSSKISAAVAEHPWLKPILPFIRTPVNILRDVAQHTPFVAKHLGEYKEAMKQGGRAARIAEGRVRVGGLLWGTGISLAMSGNITGGGPKNPIQREALLATGWRPYSIKIGDGYVNYSRLDPFGMFLGICADYSEIVANVGEDEGIGEAIVAMIFALPKNLTSKTYLKGLSDTLLAISDPERNAEWVLRQKALSYIPAFLQQTRRTTDPEMKQVETILDHIKDKIPGLASTLPTQYSWLTGKPVLYHGGIASGISPIVWSSSEKDKEVLGTELSKYSKAFTKPPEKYKGVALSGEQISEFHRLHGTLKIGGKTLEESLLDLFKSPQYDKEGERFPKDDDPVSGRRAMLIRGTVEKYRSRAFSELMKNDPTIRDGMRAARREQALNRIRSYAQ